MRRAGAAVALGAALLLTLALWVTTASNVDLLHGSSTPASSTPATIAHPTAQSPQPPRPADMDGTGFGGWTQVLLYTILALMCAALLSLIVRTVSRRQRRRRTRRPVGGAWEPATVGGLVDVPEELVAATESQHDALLRGTARNAIVACWVALEDAAEEVGLTRSPAETALEFTERVLGSHTVDSSAISELAGLYREARFSEHPITEHHRDRAIAALHRLDAELRSAHVVTRPVHEPQA